ncbi:hypothetical protein V3C99_004274 [Haemonchus contortus]|uniref:Uncharacterized protein n=1 Tax=Haemonchus contortus TaxID=6289 RepID=A0A7I4XWW6_HAECO
MTEKEIGDRLKGENDSAKSWDDRNVRIDGIDGRLTEERGTNTDDGRTDGRGVKSRLDRHHPPPPPPPRPPSTLRPLYLLSPFATRLFDVFGRGDDRRPTDDDDRRRRIPPAAAHTAGVHNGRRGSACRHFPNKHFPLLFGFCSGSTSAGRHKNHSKFK